jgi:hypothetical protein
MSSDSPFTLYSPEPKIKILDFNNINNRINIKISSLILVLIILILVVMYLFTKNNKQYPKRKKIQYDNMPWV